MDSELHFLKERLKRADDFISDFEQDCYVYVADIATKVCKRAIKVMNKQMESTPLWDDFPKNFTFFDRFSVLYQTHSLSEMALDDMLEDYITNSLVNEFEKLSGVEQIVLLYSETSNYEVCDINTLLFNHFLGLADKHTSTAKISNFLDRR